MKKRMNKGMDSKNEKENNGKIYFPKEARFHFFLNHINHLTKSISLHHPIPLADGKGGSICCRERYGGEKKEVN